MEQKRNQKISINTVAVGIAIIIAAAIVIAGYFLQERTTGSESAQSTKVYSYGNQIVLERQTILSTGSNNYANKTRSEYIVCDADMQNQRTFYRYEGDAYTYGSSFNGTNLIVWSTEDPLQPDQQTRTVVDLQGNARTDNNQTDANKYRRVVSPDASREAYAVFKKNPEPVEDGMPAESFEALIVAEVSTGKTIASYAPNNFDSDFEAVYPLAFSDDGNEIYIVAQYAHPQEVGSPATWFKQTIGGSYVTILDTPFIGENGKERSFELIRLYADQHKMLGYSRWMYEGDTLGDVLTEYDIKNGSWNDVGPMPFDNEVFTSDANTRVYFLGNGNRIVQYDLATQEQQYFTKTISTKTISSVGFSPDYKLYLFSTADVEQQSDRNISSIINGVNGAGTDANTIRIYLYDIKRGTSSGIYTTSTPLYREYENDIYTNFLGFVQ